MQGQKGIGHAYRLCLHRTILVAADVEMNVEEKILNFVYSAYHIFITIFHTIDFFFLQNYMDYEQLRGIMDKIRLGSISTCEKSLCDSMQC